MTRDQHAGQGGSYEMIDGVRVLRQRTDANPPAPPFTKRGGDTRLPAQEAAPEPNGTPADPAPKRKHVTKGE